MSVHGLLWTVGTVETVRTLWALTIVTVTLDTITILNRRTLAKVCKILRSIDQDSTYKPLVGSSYKSDPCNYY